MNRQAEFAAYVAKRDELDAALVRAGTALSEIRYWLAAAMGIEPFGKMNLTPDVIRNHPDYILRNNELQASFKRLQDLNAANVKRFKSELMHEREARRAAKLASRAT